MSSDNGKGKIIYGELVREEDSESPLGLTVTFTPDANAKLYRGNKPSLRLEIKCDSSLKEDDYINIIW